MSPEFIIYHIGDGTYIAHKLPGETLIIAKMDGPLDKQQEERYADMIVEALNKEPK